MLKPKYTMSNGHNLKISLKRYSITSNCPSNNREPKITRKDPIIQPEPPYLKYLNNNLKPMITKKMGYITCHALLKSVFKTPRLSKTSIVPKPINITAIK